MSADIGEKRPAESNVENSPKKAKVNEGQAAASAGPKATPANSAAVKKQVEYYMCDQNLKTDKFFHDKISDDADGWLELSFVLSCNKIKQMRATKDDIFSALKDSDLETKEVDGKAFVRRKGGAALPTLEAKAPMQGKKRKNTNAFDGGVLCTLKGIPEEQTLFNVKEAVKKLLPEGTSVWCSSVSEVNSCVVSIGPFDKDVETVENLKVPLGGLELKPELCYGEALQQAIKLLPKMHKEQREKRAKLRQKQRQRPILLAGQKFVNINTLRGKVKEILSSRSDGEELKVGGPDYKLVRALLDYHPTKDTKTKDMTGIKVDQSSHQSSRCFWVVRAPPGECEDFSVKKCMESLEENPPYADAAPAAAAPTADAKKEGAEAEKKE